MLIHTCACLPPYHAITPSNKCVCAGWSRLSIAGKRPARRTYAVPKPPNPALLLYVNLFHSTSSVLYSLTLQCRDRASLSLMANNYWSLSVALLLSLLYCRCISPQYLAVSVYLSLSHSHCLSLSLSLSLCVSVFCCLSVSGRVTHIQ
jgi:hypothetical protein